MSEGGVLGGTATVSERFGSRAGWIYAAVWLVFLVSPFAETLQHGRGAWRVVGAIAMATFAVGYLGAFDRARSRRRGGRPPATAEAAATLLLLTGLGVLAVPSAGEKSLALLVYLTVAAMIMLPARPAWATAAVCAVVAAVLPSAVPGWDGDRSAAVSVLLAAFALWGIVGIVERNAALSRAREELARLAVEEERARFARDLHDILGHSLTVIAVKAELANRLLSSGATTPASVEMQDVERLARTALADVRTTVAGARSASLAGELASARSALAAAGVEAELPTAVDSVPESHRELFAWAVREGVTNVVRHSGASHCRITLAAERLEIVDDGRGARPAATSRLADPTLVRPDVGPTAGHGLRGLAERAAVLGATVEAGPTGAGFRLCVSAPAPAPDGASQVSPALGAARVTASAARPS